MARFIGVLATCGVLGLGSAAAAQDTTGNVEAAPGTLAGALDVLALTAPQGAPRPVIDVFLRTIGPDGNRRAASGGSLAFDIGKRQTQYLVAGDADSGDSSCNGGQARDGARSFDDMIASHQHVWQITATPRREADGRFFFELEWKRYAHGSATRPAAAGRSELALPEAQRHVVDLLHAPAGSSCAAAIVDVEVRLREDPALAEEPLQFDLWLAHVDPSGRKQVRHAVLTGLHGQRVPFAFGALRFDVPKLIADQYDLDVVSRVLGDLRGRVNRDGTIALELMTIRRDAVEQRGTDPVSGLPGGTGRKALTVRSGEPIEIEIPVGGGTMGTRAREAASPSAGTGITGGLRGSGSGTPPTEPVLLRGDSYVVNFKPFFDGHRTSLIIQARKQE